MALKNLNKLNPFPVPISENWALLLTTGTTIVVGFGMIKLGWKLFSGKLTHPSTSTSPCKSESAEASISLFEQATALEERKPAHLWNTVMFFPDYFGSKPDSTTQQFLWYFAEARLSIQACIYNSSFPELESVAAQQRDRGLIVEFVAGHEMTAETFRRRNIPCGILPRTEGTPETDQIMHHKFVVIDNEAVLTGSLNWTTDGIVVNNENVMVSTHPNIVKKYVDEFCKLKKKCEGARQFY